MAALGNTFQQFQAIGVREELSDMIYNISPAEVPFMTNAGRGKINNTFFEWQTDALAAAVSTNQKIEGDDLGSTFTAVVPTTRLGNYAEIARKDVLISGTLEATDRAGRDSEIGYQIAKLSKELKRDMETSLLANKGASAGNSTTARITGSLLAFLKTNKSKASDGTAPVYTSTPTDVWTNGTQRALTEALVKDVIQQCWTNGAEPKTLMVGALGKQAVSGFSGVVELMADQQKGKQAKIIGAADTYVSDFGSLSVIANRFQRARDGFVIDWEYVSVDYLRPFFTTPLAKTGDAEKRMLLTEYGLRIKTEKALGVLVDLTP